jgi:hypothetical protein
VNHQRNKREPSTGKTIARVRLLRSRVVVLVAVVLFAALIVLQLRVLLRGNAGAVQRIFFANFNSSSCSIKKKNEGQYGRSCEEGF